MGGYHPRKELRNGEGRTRFARPTRGDWFSTIRGRRRRKSATVETTNTDKPVHETEIIDTRRGQAPL